MYLLSKKQTALRAFVYGLVSIILVSSLMTTIVEGNVFGIVVYALLVGVYVYIWKIYVKAFKRRIYDRQYAEVKEQLQQTLREILPTTGRITLTKDDELTFVYRHALRFSKKELFVVFTSNIEIMYDDLAKRNLMISIHSYIVSKSFLYVSKSFDTTLESTDGENNGVSESGPSKINFLTNARDILKANRSIPEDLRYASPPELSYLHNLLQEGRKDIVS